MASLTDIVAGLAGSLQAALGAEMQVSDVVLASPTPPTAQIVPATVDPHLAMGGGDEVFLAVQAFLAAVTDVGAQRQALRFFDETDPLYMVAAIERDRELGGACSDLIVQRAAWRYWRDLPDGPAVGGEWTVRILV